MSDLNSSRAIADIDSGLILAAIVIAAPPDRVFTSLCSNEIVGWWSPDESCRIAGGNADPAIGGKWKAVGQWEGGKDFQVEGVFLEIDPPLKLVQSWRASWDDNRKTTLSYRLEAVEGGTQLTISHSGFMGRPDSCRDHAGGWERVLGRLADHLAPKDEGTVFVCKLCAPRPTFFADMTDEERKIIDAHTDFWIPYAENGTVIVLGPVSDPGGSFGLGMTRVADADALAALLAQDPAIKSGLGFSYETAPMIGPGH